MSLSDPIANMLTSIRNAIQARKETVDIPASNMIGKILGIFKETSYIEDFRLLKSNVQGAYRVYLKYDGKKSVVSGIRRISRPGLRVYVSGSRIPKVLNGLGTAVLSTSKGVVTDHEARKLRTGGEVICYIW